MDELRSRVSIADVVGRKVMWDQRKSNVGKGDLWAPCPFHHEKSASFHVDDRKGYYYCFGCQAKGDALKFIQETENVGFMEAVEILAREAGMELPARDPKAQQKQDRRTLLIDVMEQAVQFFRLQLKTGNGSMARSYLQRRGLTPPALERWEIGFAPDGWQNLWDHLRGKNVPEDLILAAGLAKASTKGGKPYDTFRNRIMFPIRDARGRAIAFGGRAMDPNDNAKYLNSPETDLFDKGRSLYNHAPARAAAGRGTPLIVAEGYMDVIALSEGGFQSSVAPLGTAVTENQLQMLWRMADEPIIALDGDTAGLRAAMRVIDLALPLLQAGKSLRFAIMPDGQDPDDLIKAKGPEAVQAVLDQAMPMVKLLWQRETEGKVFDSPERKAALDKALREKIMMIKDPSIRSHYGQEIKDLRWQLFRPQKAKRDFSPVARASGGGKWAPAPQGPSPSAKSSILVTAAGLGATEHLREAVILMALLGCPQLVEEFENGLAAMRCQDPDHGRIRDLMLRHVHHDPAVLREKIYDAVGEYTLENMLSQRHVAITPCIRSPGNLEKTRMTVAEELGKLEAVRGLDEEIADAVEDLTGTADEGLTWRLGEAARNADRAQRSGQEDTAEYDIAENGAHISRDERSAFDALLGSILKGDAKDKK